MHGLSVGVMTFLINAVWQLPTMVILASACDMLMRRVPARHRHGIWVATLVLSVALPIWSVVTPADIDGSSPTSRGQAEARPMETQAVMHVLPKNRVSAMFDIDIIGNEEQSFRPWLTLTRQ